MAKKIRRAPLMVTTRELWDINNGLGHRIEYKKGVGEKKGIIRYLENLRKRVYAQYLTMALEDDMKRARRKP